MIWRIPAAVLLLLPTLTLANPADDAWNAYLAGRFDQVARIAESSSSDSSLTSHDRGRILSALGCSQAMQGHSAEATSSFLLALKWDSSIKFREDDLPPPAWRIYKQTHDQFVAAPVSIVAAPQVPQSRLPDTVKVTVREPVSHSREAVLRSLLWPGWGHLTEHDSRGAWLAAAEGVLVAGTIMSGVASNNARERYLKATAGSIASDRYDRYNNYYRLTWGIGVGAAALYFVAQYDFFSRPPLLAMSLEPGRGIVLSARF